MYRVHNKGLKAAAADAGVSVRTASKWLARFRSEGEAGLIPIRPTSRRSRFSAPRWPTTRAWASPSCGC
ncbi:MAG: helix-turn-helix domain-containing protein [Xanthomonadaceae bacterium]|nr:helix-turn-helix domain-containing protein [Xanthomonadaceae bacterium]